MEAKAKIAKLKEDYKNGSVVLKKGDKVWAKEGLMADGTDGSGNQKVCSHFPTPTKEEWERNGRLSDNFSIFKKYTFIQIPKKILDWDWEKK